MYSSVKRFKNHILLGFVMNTTTRVIIYFAATVLVMVVLFHAIADLNEKRKFDAKNELCIQITQEMNRNVNESTSCKDYYCYYARYAPPEGYEQKTETLCICDCSTLNGTIVSTQILSVTNLSSSSNSLFSK